jgi:molecular chaperone DnaK
MKNVVAVIPPCLNSDKGIKDLSDSLIQAGMNPVKLIDESQAAALAYEIDKKTDIKSFLVFNMGGLCFSIEHIIKKELPELKEGEEFDFKNQEMFEIKRTLKDDFLGGEDIDLALQEFLIYEFKRTNKMDISDDYFALQR